VCLNSALGPGISCTKELMPLPTRVWHDEATADQFFQDVASFLRLIFSYSLSDVSHSNVVAVETFILLTAGTEVFSANVHF